MIFAVFDVLLAVNVCLNYSFLYIFILKYDHVGALNTGGV